MPRKLLRYVARLPAARELINFNSRSCVVQLQARARNKKIQRAARNKDVVARFARILVALCARVCLPQIVNRNLIGRFTVFVGEARRRRARFAFSFCVCARGAFSRTHARTHDTRVVYATARVYRSPVVCQPLNTGHPRSSPLFSPLYTSRPIARLS